LSQSAWHPDAQTLIDRTCTRTGLREFGDPPVAPPLSVLTRSLAEEANLHRLGRFLARVHLRDLLEKRLRLAAAWRQENDSAKWEVLRPIFVTGMPRSGSTFLHEMLALDPALRAPRVWEVMYPLGVYRGSGNGAAQVWRAETSLWWFRRLAPQADAVYPMRARTPHECVAMHSYTFLSQEFVSSFHIPRYETFLDGSDLGPTYAWQKRFLQHLQSGHAPRRWVLKSPDHARSLEALWKVFPDAFLIQTHRHPLETLVSSSHLTEVLRGLFAPPQRRRDIGRREARVLAENMERIMRFRDTHPELADRFIDVHYGELIANPVRTVRRIYARLGQPLPDATAARMEQLAGRRSRYGNGQPRNGHPALTEFGLDDTAEVRRFEGYCTRFGISRHAN
jgi:hypothetical protein